MLLNRILQDFKKNKFLIVHTKSNGIIHDESEMFDIYFFLYFWKLFSCGIKINILLNSTPNNFCCGSIITSEEYLYCKVRNISRVYEPKKEYEKSNSYLE
jgi:hypothetical protein